MRSSFVLLLFTVTLVVWSNEFANAKAFAKTNSLETNVDLRKSATARRYLKGSNVATKDGDFTSNAKDEERITFPGSTKLKSLFHNIPDVNKMFQKNPTLAKNLENVQVSENSAKKMVTMLQQNPAALVKNLEKAGISEKGAKTMTTLIKKYPSEKKQWIVAVVIATLLFGSVGVTTYFLAK